MERKGYITSFLQAIFNKNKIYLMNAIEFFGQIELDQQQDDSELIYYINAINTGDTSHLSSKQIKTMQCRTVQAISNCQCIMIEKSFLNL